MAAQMSLLSPSALTASRREVARTSARALLLPGQLPASRAVVSRRSLHSQVLRAQPVETDGTKTEVDVDGIVKDLQDKWDSVENKTSVAVYGIGAIVLLWLSSTIVSAVNAVPLLPKLLELVGLGYTAWFVYRYLLFKSSREELLQDVEELKKRITGAVETNKPQ